MDQEDVENKRPNAFPLVGDADIPTIFANDVFIEVNANDISVVFIHAFNSYSGRQNKPLARVALSHAGFVQIAEFFNTRSDFLKSLYGGNPPSAFDVPPEVFNKALEEMDRHRNEGYLNDSVEQDDNVE